MAITRHVYRVHIKSPIDVVWNALIDPAVTRRYFHTTAFETPPQTGQPYRTVDAAGCGAVDGTIEEMSPPNRLVMTWHTLYDPAMADEPPSRIEWTLTEVGDGLTQLDLIHGDLARSPLTWAGVRDGWVWIVDGLKTLLETGEELPAVTVESPLPDDAAGEWHRAQGIECNNGAWEMIDAERTPQNDEEMLRRAYASAYHWQRAARRGPENEARATYMLAKVQLLNGQPGLSLRYAESCMATCQQHGIVDFDLAYAHEARARALHALGRFDEASAAWDAAVAVPINDPDDKAILDGDLAVAL
jgi:uncharacterized protein YndB with AHSA1/START domain